MRSRTNARLSSRPHAEKVADVVVEKLVCDLKRSSVNKKKKGIESQVGVGSTERKRETGRKLLKYKFEIDKQGSRSQ